MPPVMKHLMMKSRPTPRLDVLRHRNRLHGSETPAQHQQPVSWTDLVVFCQMGISCFQSKMWNESLLPATCLRQPRQGLVCAGPGSLPALLGRSGMMSARCVKPLTTRTTKQRRVGRRACVEAPSSAAPEFWVQEFFLFLGSSSS